MGANSLKHRCPTVRLKERHSSGWPLAAFCLILTTLGIEPRSFMLITMSLVRPTMPKSQSFCLMNYRSSFQLFILNVELRNCLIYYIIVTLGVKKIPSIGSCKQMLSISYNTLKKKAVDIFTSP